MWNKEPCSLHENFANGTSSVICMGLKRGCLSWEQMGHMFPTSANILCFRGKTEGESGFKPGSGQESHCSWSSNTKQGLRFSRGIPQGRLDRFPWNSLTSSLKTVWLVPKEQLSLFLKKCWCSKGTYWLVPNDHHG